MAQLIAVIDKTRKIKFGDLQDVCKAIQIQVTNDLNPVWGKDATIVAYSEADVIPYHAWKTSIQDALDIDVYGYHFVDDNGKPFAVLKYRTDWSLTLSHEVVEMIIDPYGNRVMNVENFFCCQDCAEGKGECESLVPAEVNGVKEVLVEIADPSQAPNFGYYITVGNRKVLCSDFYYPAYFTDVRAVKGKKYSHTGSITRPKEILEGGYISFKNRSGEWWQAFKVQGKIIFKKVGSSQETLSNQDIMTILTVALYGIGATIFALVIKSILSRKKDEIPSENTP